MSKTTHVIYHKSDFDGIFCREIARKFLPGATLIGWEYGEPEPVIPPEDTLYILDLSVPGLMAHPNLVWIDHHLSAIEKYSAGTVGYRIDGVAACRLAWQWFSHDHTDPVVQYNGLPDKQEFIDRKVTEPWAVRLAGEYDVWDKRDPRAELFQHGLRSLEISAALWDGLLSTEDVGVAVTFNMLERAEAVAYATQSHNDLVIGNNGFDLEWEGLRFLACNNGSYNSFLFTAGIKPHHDGLLGFCLRANRKWSVSLYGVPGKPDVDLSKIAVKYGGGGHRQACGFTVSTLPFNPQLILS